MHGTSFYTTDAISVTQPTVMKDWKKYFHLFVFANNLQKQFLTLHSQAYTYT